MDELMDKHGKIKRDQEVKLFKQLKADYKIIEKSLMEEAERLLADPNKATERQRVLKIVDMVQRELQGFANHSIRPTVASEMVQASLFGEDQAIDLLKSVVPETVVIAVLPKRAIESLSRTLYTGPTAQLLDSFGAVAAQKARRDLLTGMALGQNPRKLTGTLRRSLGTSQTRAFLIARTETMRAHREGTRQSYLANRNLVQSWVWHASASARTCAACWSMHGSEHPLDEPMVSHPACRCSMVPKTKTWREMGYDIDESAPPVPSGEDLFAQQDESTQRAVLGKKQYERYKNGEVTLSDFVAIKPSRYGNTITKVTPK